MFIMEDKKLVKFAFMYDIPFVTSETNLSNYVPKKENSCDKLVGLRTEKTNKIKTAEPQECGKLHAPNNEKASSHPLENDKRRLPPRRTADCNGR